MQSFFFFQAEDGIRDYKVTGVQTCALPIYSPGQAGESWRLDKLDLGVTVTASAGTILEVFLVQESRVYSSLSPSTYVYNSLNQYNEFTFYPSEILSTFSETLLSSGSSLVLIAKTGVIQSLSVNSLNLIFLPKVESSNAISPQAFAGYYAYLLTF